jgi:hypothetical protein
MTATTVTVVLACVAACVVGFALRYALAAMPRRMPAQHADHPRRVVEDAVREAWEAARRHAAAIAEPLPPVADRWQVACSKAAAAGRASVQPSTPTPGQHRRIDPLTAPLEQVLADSPTTAIRTTAPGAAA